MPIVAYTGLPGHGKSHSVVEYVILPALREGRCVVTNVALNLDVIRQEIPGCDVRAFDIDALKDAPAKVDEIVPAGAVWVIDEAWKLWPSGQSADKTPLPFRSILAEHRHRVDEAGRSMQVVIVTQDLMQVASFARQLIEQTFRTVKLSKLGMDKRYRVDIFDGPASGPNPPVSKRTGQSGGSYRKEIWRFYKTHTMSQAGAGSEGANERSVDRRFVVWRSPIWWLGAPLVLLALVVGSWKVWQFFHPPAAPAKSVPSERPSGGPAVRRAVGNASSVSTWTVGGYVLAGRESLVWLVDGARYVMLALDDYCDLDAGGFVVCRFEGQVESSRYRPLPRGATSQTLSVLGQPVVTAGTLDHSSQ